MLRYFQVPEPEGVEIPEEFAHAIRVAYVYVEGDCELLEKFMNGVSEKVRKVSSAKRGAFDALLDMLVSEARKCTVRLMWGEVSVEVADEEQGEMLHIVIRGVPLEVLLVAKALCGQRVIARWLSR
ncbi:MAG TPA: hypothetical protein EYP20_01210 [Aigarchaeota archaeon]|nr:hypothetical protein [Aigarchaeota archaeon]